MERININRTLRVKAIYFKGNTEPLKNRLVWVAANFLVVAKDENDTAPTWFNTDQVKRMEGVELVREVPRTRMEQRMAFL